MPLRFGSRTYLEQRSAVMATVNGSSSADLPDSVAKAVADGADIVELVECPSERVAATVRVVRERFPSLMIGVAARNPMEADAAIDAGACLLTVTGIAAVAEVSAGVVSAGLDDAQLRHASGQARESILVDVTHAPDPLGQATALADAGWAVLATSERLVDESPDASLAATALGAAAGVRVFRTGNVKRTRRTVDMVASIAGTRPPARVLRALA